MNLPKTNFHQYPNNRLSKTFWGRVELQNASSFLFFKKGGAVQNLMHALKYKGIKEIGELLGNLYSMDLLNFNGFDVPDAIVPVPLHPDKLKKRGYNQSEWFGKGLAEGLKIPIITNALVRNIQTESQTKKNRWSRWQNVEKVFELINPEIIENKHILLVDDVVTTGATLEACSNELLGQKHVRVSVATLAYAL